MFEKNGKFYADWRDRSGKRLRKSFTSKRAALMFEADQRELAHPKQNARGQALRPSSSRSLVAVGLSISKPRRQSSQLLEASSPTSSLRLMSPRLTKGFGVAVSRPARGAFAAASSARISGTSGSTTVRPSSIASSRKFPASGRATSQSPTTKGKRS